MGKPLATEARGRRRGGLRRVPNSQVSPPNSQGLSAAAATLGFSDQGIMRVQLLRRVRVGGHPHLGGALIVAMLGAHNRLPRDFDRLGWQRTASDTRTLAKLARLMSLCRVRLGTIFCRLSVSPDMFLRTAAFTLIGVEQMSLRTVIPSSVVGAAAVA